MKTMEKKCCFSGYRPEKLQYLKKKDDKRYIALRSLLEKAIAEAIEDGYTRFLSGFAMGVDLMAAEIVIEMRKTHEITLEAVLPCMNQTAYWEKEDAKRYYQLLDAVDCKVCLDTMGTRESYLKRNRYMVDASERVIAIFDGKSGGTKYTVAYARRKKREIVLIDPSALEILPREQQLF